MPMQPITCTNEVLSSTSTKFNLYFGRFKTYKRPHQPKKGLNLVDVLENPSFVHVFGCTDMFELTVTGWWIIVT